MNTNTKKRRFIVPIVAVLCVAAVLAGFLSGCNNLAGPGGSDDTTALPPAEDTGLTIRIYQPNAGQAALWQELAADYRNLTGVSVDVKSPEGGEPGNELKDMLKADAGAPGIFVFTNPREYGMWKEYAEPLSDTQAYQHLIDTRMALTADGKVVALPLSVEPFGIIYNKKILANYFALENKDTSYEAVSDITTYRQLTRLAEDMNDLKDELKIDGVFAAPALKEGESAVWTTRLMSVPLGHEIAGRKTELTGETLDELTIRYANGYRSLHDLMLNNGTTRRYLDERSYADAVKEFATGKAAMIPGGSEFLGHLNSAVGQTVSADEIAFLPAFMDIEDVPTQGLAFDVTGYLAINGKLSEEERKAAGEFLNWLFTSERGMDFLATKLNVLAPYDTETEESLPRNPLIADAFAWLKKSEAGNVLTWSSLTPGEEFRDKVFGKGLLAYSTGKTDWEDFKSDLREGWGKLRGKME
ncbi:MAG: ABC transporter substrate-binding protein [Oscillospiraceae bacterium]|jgi:raffinose/stachyose/melibiose transport system substrate-binding protein|nr:ABC transporter substrate-binding protein [Oscillospiraceae bacterium]